MSDINDIKESLATIKNDIDWIKRTIQCYNDQFTTKDQHKELCNRLDKVEHNYWWLLIGFVLAVGGFIIFVLEKGIKI